MIRGRAGGMAWEGKSIMADSEAGRVTVETFGLWKKGASSSLAPALAFAVAPSCASPTERRRLDAGNALELEAHLFLIGLLPHEIAFDGVDCDFSQPSTSPLLRTFDDSVFAKLRPNIDRLLQVDGHAGRRTPLRYTDHYLQLLRAWLADQPTPTHPATHPVADPARRFVHATFCTF